MHSIAWLTEELNKNVKGSDTVLDLGCGIMGMTRNLKYKTIVGVDVWYPYIHSIKELCPVLCMKIDSKTIYHFVDNSFDVVLALDFIEHLEDKEEAFKLIRHMERIARKRVVIYTPKGYVEQKDGEAWGEGNPKYQSHKLGFTPSEFAMMGYVVDERKGIHKGKNIDAIFAVKVVGDV